MMNNNLCKVVLASSNCGKLVEFQQMLNPLGIEVLSQKQFGIGSQFPIVEETGLTFVENAIIKARYASEISYLPVIADDSGLEVDYLNGEPGVYSARYAGENATDEENNQKLLERLKGIELSKRTARFQCVLVFMRFQLDPTPVICQASWKGVILETARGCNGFGYDPLFLVPSEEATVAELSAEMKNKLSHRAQAVLKFLTYFKETAS